MKENIGMNPREHRHESVLTQRLLIQITFDALFGRLLEIILPQFKPGNLAIPGDNPIYHLDIIPCDSIRFQSG